MTDYAHMNQGNAKLKPNEKVFKTNPDYRSARDNNDEKHITPLQLDTIERILHLYSNEGETVFSPFAGIGSEGFEAVRMKRNALLIELKDSYFNVGVKNLKSIVQESEQVLTLF